MRNFIALNMPNMPAFVLQCFQMFQKAPSERMAIWNAHKIHHDLGPATAISFPREHHLLLHCSARRHSKSRMRRTENQNWDYNESTNKSTLWMERSKAPYGKTTQKSTSKYQSYKLHKNDQAINQQAPLLPSFKKACTFCIWTCCSDLTSPDYTNQMPQNLQQIGNIWPSEPHPLATQMALQELGHTLQKGIDKQPTQISSNLTVLRFDSRFHLDGTFKTWSQSAYLHWLPHFQVTSVSVASCTTTH